MSLSDTIAGLGNSLVNLFNKNIVEAAETASTAASNAASSATAASASATTATNASNSAASSASSASTSASSAIQALRDATLINNSGNADTLSTANAADIIELNNALNTEIEKVYTLYEEASEWEQKDYVNLSGKLWYKDGTTRDISGYWVSDKMPCDEYDSIIVSAKPLDSNWTTVMFFDANSNIVGRALEYYDAPTTWHLKEEVKVPSNAKYFICQSHASGEYTEEWHFWVKKLKNYKALYKKGKNLFDKTKIVTGKYLSPNGRWTGSNADYFYSDYIEVEPSATYVMTHEDGGGGGFVQYDENKNYITGQTMGNFAQNGYTITMGSTTKYVRFSHYLSKLNILQFEKSSFVTPYEDYTIKQDTISILEKSCNVIPTTHSVVNVNTSYNKVTSFVIPNIKNDYTINAHIEITTMGQISLAVARGISNIGYQIIVTDTQLKMYANNNNNFANYNHGLTISEVLEIMIHVKNQTRADVILSTGSGTYKQEVQWLGGGSPAELWLQSGTYTYADLRYTPSSLLKDIWMYGDSYFDYYNGVLPTLGFTNITLDGYSGRGSVNAFNSLFKAIDTYKRIPKMIVWAMGMNDLETNGANADWDSTVQKLEQLCDYYGITLIYITIPNVPDRSNNYKNTYIRNCGRRYIDIAKAVGSDNNSHWFTGLLRSDNVHPSDSGVKFILNRILGELPILE